MVRNAGKFGKAKRGGGRHFSRDLSRLNSDGESEKGSESSEESSSEEEDTTVDDARNRVGQLPPITNSDDEEEPSYGIQANLNSTLSTMSLAPPPDAPAVSNSRLGAMNAEKVAQARLERKMAQGAKKASGTKVKGSGSDESEEENDNHKAGKMMKAADLGAPREMSRREREQADKAAAKERYAKLHAAGKTDEAKADLGRLAQIRKQRELAAAQRIAETAAKEASSKAALEKSGKKVPLRR